jgi:hypothetical protein
MSANRIVICPTCERDIQVRSSFAYMTLTSHMKEHSNG